MYCSNCGGQIDDHATFCPHCGKRISAAKELQEPRLGYRVILAHGLQILGSIFLLLFPILTVYIDYEDDFFTQTLGIRNREVYGHMSIFRGDQGDWPHDFEMIETGASVLGILFIFLIVALIVLSLMKRKYKISGIGSFLACLGTIFIFQSMLQIKFWTEMSTGLNDFAYLALLLFGAAALLLMGGAADSLGWMTQTKRFKVAKGLLIAGTLLLILLGPLGTLLILIGLVLIQTVYLQGPPKQQKHS